MRMILKSLHMENFKGIKSLDVNFSNKTSIKGQNAVGKTTIFDAFTWLLFNKNSAGEENSMSDHWIRTDTALITWKSRLLVLLI